MLKAALWKQVIENSCHRWSGRRKRNQENTVCVLIIGVLIKRFSRMNGQFRRDRDTGPWSVSFTNPVFYKRLETLISNELKCFQWEIIGYMIGSYFYFFDAKFWSTYFKMMTCSKLWYQLCSLYNSVEVCSLVTKV